MREIIDIFKEIAKIPHCSFKAQKLKEFIEKEAVKAGCEVKTDESGNILAKKSPSKICLQSHYDMVCMGKAPDIEVIEEDGFLKAKNSSLGADNGIGVAMSLYFLKKYDNLEALFTADEEVGLIGAVNLNLKIESKNLLNLDSEEEGHIFIGCAGGVDIYGDKEVEWKEFEKENEFYKIEIKDLPGGHSGIDIDKDIKNAIKELFLYLKDLKDVKIVDVKGGEALNSIPKNAYAVVSFKGEFEERENIKVTKLSSKHDRYIKDSDTLIKAFCSFAQGVRSYEKEFDIPKTSINFGEIFIKDGVLKTSFFARSMNNEDLRRIKKETICFLEAFGFKARTKHEFPAWKPEINDFSVKVREIFEKYFENVDFKAIHAGLECGIIQDKFEGLKTVSVGPNIYFPHSEKEKCEIESVYRVSKALDSLIKEMQ